MEWFYIHVASLVAIISSIAYIGYVDAEDNKVKS